MPRTHFAASTLPLAALLAWTSACAVAPPGPPQPAPVAAAEPVPVAVPADAAPEPETVAMAVDAGVAAGRFFSVPSGPELLGSASYDLPVVANQSVASEVSFLVNERH